MHAVLSGYGDRITFAVGDVHELEYPDDTFDVVHAHEVLQHVDDPVRALREMKRVCKPGGIVAARGCDYDAFFLHPEIPALAEWVRLHTAVARANGGEGGHATPEDPARPAEGWTAWRDAPDGRLAIPRGEIIVRA